METPLISRMTWFLSVVIRPSNSVWTIFHDLSFIGPLISTRVSDTDCLILGDHKKPDQDRRSKHDDLNLLILESRKTLLRRLLGCFSKADFTIIDPDVETTFWVVANPSLIHDGRALPSIIG